MLFSQQSQVASAPPLPPIVLGNFVDVFNVPLFAAGAIKPQVCVLLGVKSAAPGTAGGREVLRAEFFTTDGRVVQVIARLFLLSADNLL